MKAHEAHNDNDPWTRISLAALRVLTQIYETKYCAACEEQQASSNSERGENDGQHANGAGVVIENKKRSSL